MKAKRIATPLAILSALGLAMALLFAAGPGERPRATPEVAILLFDGVQIIDFAGPYEVFGQADWRVSTVAESTRPITTAMGMTVVPHYAFGEHPRPDVLVLPGGAVERHLSPRVLAWIRDNARDAEVVLSVCNGAFFLARAGLLDGLEATTFAALIPALREAAPKARIVSDKRFVDNGKIVTTAGLSSGIDGALHVVEKLRGRGRAQRVALGLEYDWRPDSNYARAALADRHVRVELPYGLEFELLRTEGDTGRWIKQWSAETERSPAELLAQLDAVLASGNRWTRLSATTPAGAAAASRWRFTDEQGKPWSGTATVRPRPGEDGVLEVSIEVKRGS